MGWSTEARGVVSARAAPRTGIAPPARDLPLAILLQRGAGIARWPVDTRRVRRWIGAAQEVPLSLVVRLVGELEAGELNRRWRGRDAACNVLTFAYGPIAQEQTSLASARPAKASLAGVSPPPGSCAEASASGRGASVSDGLAPLQRWTSADMVLCLPVAERESGERGIPLAAHLAHLIVHGVLHAQDYTHEEEEAALRMELREAAILARFGIPDPYAR